MIRFEVKQHHVRTGVEIVEVYDGNKFIATLTPLSDIEGTGFRIVSRHIEQDPVTIGKLDDDVKVWQFKRKRK
jgi:hypothetical protein